MTTQPPSDSATPTGAKSRKVKRGNGEGSIRERKDGRWEVAVVDPVTRKRRSAYAKTEAEAKRVLRRMTAKADEGATVLDAGATLKTYAESWITDRAGRRRRASTVREYEYRLNHWVIPVLGRLRLREITVVDVEDLLDRLASKGLTTGTVASIRNALAALMHDAVRARHLTTNVARLAQLPEGGEKLPLSPPTDEEVGALMAAVEGTALEPIVTVCVGTGARIGEVLAMRWADLDLKVGTWRVARTVTRTRQGAYVIGARTKTGRSREVALTPEVVEALRGQYRRVRKTQMRAAYWQDGDLVFPSTIGTAQDPNNVRRDLRRYASAVGFPGSFHALRHWFASLAVTLAPDVSVAKVLGHARVSTTTDIYSHLRESDASKIAVAVSVAVKAAKG